MFLVMSIHELLRWAIFPNPKLIQQRVATGLVKLNTCQLEFLNLNFSFFFGGGGGFFRNSSSLRAQFPTGGLVARAEISALQPGEEDPELGISIHGFSVSKER